MKTKVTIIISLIFGFLAGIIFTAITINLSAKPMLVKEFKSPYDFDKTVQVMIDRINNKEGWHVTNVIDQNKAVSENGGFPIGNFKIIKYCHGRFSAEMLKTDDRKMMGVMMPKSFAVYQKSDGQVYVSTMNGAVIGKLFGGVEERIIEESSLEIEDIMRFINLKFTLF
ncbi:MAG: DUF302 domain-containing protein [Chlorobi bacterium]|nr:DUF302 domain-containing protein [Chlorobiota bacterium]